MLAGFVLMGLLLTLYYYTSAPLGLHEVKLKRGSTFLPGGSVQKISAVDDKSRPIIACFYDPSSAQRMNWGYDLNTDFKHGNCTHIIYQSLLYTDGRVRAEGGARAYIPRFVALKRPGLTLMASLTFEDPSKVVESAETFSKKLVTWVTTSGFQGVDVDISWDGNATLFNTIVKMTDKAIRDKGLILSANVYFTESFMAAVDINDLYESTDFLVLNTYNLTSNPKRTSAPAALYGNASWNESLGIVYKATRNVARLVPTISFMSREFELVDPFTSEDVRSGLPSVDYGPPGVYTNTRGLLAYYEVCDTFRDYLWTRQWQITEFCYMTVNRKRFLVLEDESSVSCKMRYLTQHRFAGVSLKNMDMDVFREKCGKINPLFLTVLHVLLEYTVPVDAFIPWPSPDPVPKGIIKADGKVECIRETWH